jgi:hypothetical protein
LQDFNGKFERESRDWRFWEQGEQIPEAKGVTS